MRWDREPRVRIVAGIIATALTVNTYGSGGLLGRRALSQAHQGSSPDKLDYVVGTEFLHYSAAVGFNGPFGTVQNRGYLPAASSFENQLENLSFGACQRSGRNGAATGWLPEQGFDGRNKTLPLERLLDEVGRAGFDGLDGRWNVTVAGNNKNRQPRCTTLGFGQQLQAVHVRHFDVGNQQAAFSQAKTPEAVGGGGETSDLDTLPPECFLDDTTDIRLIVNEENVMLFGVNQCQPQISYFAFSGKVRKKVEPLRHLLSIRIFPPHSEMIRWTIARPKPVPWPRGLVVK